MSGRVLREVVRVWLGGPTRTEAELVAEIRRAFQVGVLAEVERNPAEGDGQDLVAGGGIGGGDVAERENPAVVTIADDEMIVADGDEVAVEGCTGWEDPAAAGQPIYQPSDQPSNRPSAEPTRRPFSRFATITTSAIVATERSTPVATVVGPILPLSHIQNIIAVNVAANVPTIRSAIKSSIVAASVATIFTAATETNIEAFLHTISESFPRT